MQIAKTLWHTTRELGGEILDELTIEPIAFVSGVGTGGTLMGIGMRLKENFKDMKIVAIEPDKMPMISQGKIISQHKIEGIGDDFIPELVEKSAIDDVILINDDDAIRMAKKLSRELGLGVGISSGANFIGAVLANEKYGRIDEQGNLMASVTVFADDNKKYLSTDMFEELDDNRNFVFGGIKLLRFEVI